MSIRDEVREARLAREARDAARRAQSSGSGNPVDPGRRPRASLFRAPSLAPRPPSSYRLTSALGRAVAAAASTAVGHAREGAANALAAARGTRRSDLVSDEALRRIMDRIAADRAAFDTGAADVSRPDAAALGLSEAEIAKLPDVVWAPAAATNEDAGDASVRVDDGDEKDALEKKKKAKGPDECAVCFVAFEPGDALKSLPCGHTGFHLACIRTWLERSPTCPLCRCACRPADVPGDIPADLPADLPGDDPDLRSETFERHLAELTAMREEESAWLDRLEAQPMRRATEASGDATARGRVSSGVPGDGDIPGDEDETAVGAGSSQVPNLPASLSPAERHAAFAPFDPGATSYMRRNYAELVRLREEEHALVARLDRLAATEEELHARIEDATRRRDEALRRRDAERVPESRGGRAGATTSTSTSSFALAAAERDHRSRVNAVDALARWRSRE